MLNILLLNIQSVNFHWMHWIYCQKVKQLNFAWGLKEKEIGLRRLHVREVNVLVKYKGHQHCSEANFMKFLRVLKFTICPYMWCLNWPSKLSEIITKKYILKQLSYIWISWIIIIILYHHFKVVALVFPETLRKLKQFFSPKYQLWKQVMIFWPPRI